jgi:hypothetical protein
VRRIATLVATVALVCTFWAPGGAAGATGSGDQADASRALVQYKLSHGYLVGDPARYDRLKARAAAAAAIHQASPTVRPAGASPVIGPSFRGLDQDDLSPPDPTGAIGPFSYLQAINLQLGIYSRSGALIDSAPFAEVVGSGADMLSDPQALWDPHTNRFFYLILNVGSLTAPKSTMFWGFSKTNRPSSLATDFCNYETSFGWEGTIADYPKLGQTKDFLLVGVNVYPTAATFLESDVGWISKPQGKRPVATCPPESSFASGKRTMLLSDDLTLASTPEPAKQVDPSSTGWIVAVPDPTNSGAIGTKLELYEVSKNSNGTAHIQQVGTPVPVAQYSPPAPAPQKLSVHLLDTLDGRLTNAITAVDPAHGNTTALWTGHTVFGGAGAEFRWYEIDVANAGVFQSGEATHASLFVFNGSISPDRVFRSTRARGFGSNMVTGFSTSSSTSFPAIRAVSKRGSNPQSRFVLIKSSPGADDGFDCFELEKCRWGDYAGAAPDPARKLNKATGRVWLDNMWVSGEVDPLAATWRTWIWAAIP